MPGGTADHTRAPHERRAPAWRRACALGLVLAVTLVAFSGCATQVRRLSPDWEDPGQRLVGARLAPLLQAAGRDPAACEVAFLDTEHVNATSEGGCRFAFTTGLAATGDRTLFDGIAAHEVAHEVLGHADSRALAIITVRGLQEALAKAPGWGAIASVAVGVAGLIVLPAYSRAQEAAADTKALEILRACGSSDPAGTLVYAFEMLITREGDRGGSLLSSHPAMTARLDALRPLATHAPCTESDPQQDVFTEPRFAVSGTAPSAPTTEPPDPRADWSERYKKMAEVAAGTADGSDE